MAPASDAAIFSTTLLAFRLEDDDDDESATSSVAAVASAASSYVSAAAVVTARGLQNPPVPSLLIPPQDDLESMKRPQNAAECARARAKRSGRVAAAAERRKEDKEGEEE